jgi:replicative DNA helicase
MEPKSIPLVGSEIASTDFHVGEYAAIYRAMTALSADGKSIDVVSIQQVTGSPVNVMELSIGHRADPLEYAAIIKKKALDRRVLAAMAEVTAAVDRDEGDIVTTLHTKVTDLLRGTTNGHLIPASGAVAEYRLLLKERLAGEVYGSWGIPRMDSHLNPPAPGRMVILASRPGVGKTAMAEAIVDHWARAGKGPVLFASLEMDRLELLDRATARLSGVTAQGIMRGDLDAGDQALVQAALDTHATLPIEYLDDARTTTDTLRAKIARVRLQHGGLYAVVVDYLQLLADGGDDNPVYRVTKISRELKAIAREFGVPVLALSQLNRKIEMRGDDEPPQLDDLRESGALEQDADAVVVLTGRRGTGVRTAHILKQRSGEVGTFRVLFDGSTCRWHEPTPRWDDVIKQSQEKPEKVAVEW